MLPICKSTVHLPRKDISPVWTRSFPVSKQPKTLGQHLRKKRFDSGLRHSEVAQQRQLSQAQGAFSDKRTVFNYKLVDFGLLML